MSAFGSKDTKGAYSRVEHQDEETGDDVAMVSASPLADGQAPVATENPSTASAVVRMCTCPPHQEVMKMIMRN